MWLADTVRIEEIRAPEGGIRQDIGQIRFRRRNLWRGSHGLGEGGQILTAENAVLRIQERRGDRASAGHVVDRVVGIEGPQIVGAQGFVVDEVNWRGDDVRRERVGDGNGSACGADAGDAAGVGIIVLARDGDGAEIARDQIRRIHRAAGSDRRRIRRAAEMLPPEIPDVERAHLIGGL